MKARTILLSTAHAAVDMACAALFFGFLLKGDVWLNMVIYNAFAFLMQLPMGVIADRFNKNMLFAGIGCALAASAFLFTSAPLLAAIVAGAGNGAFHVGGGIEVINRSRDKAGPLGVFVSPGAVGLFLGKFYADKLSPLPFIMPCVMLAFGAAIILVSFKKERFVSRNPELEVTLPKGGLLPLIALFIVVALRSFMGTTDAFSAGDCLSGLSPLWAGLVPVLLLAFGKAAGGFAADAVGTKLASVVSLGLCAAGLLFPFHPIVKLAALFLFNMTMPITLYASARLLKNARGTAFGLLTAALYIGCVPYFLAGGISLSNYVSALLAFASLILLLAGLKKEAA